MHSRNSKPNPQPNVLLRREREARNWTLQDVADRLYQMCLKEGRASGISSDTVGRWERGISHPEAHYRTKLCILYEKEAVELGLIEQEQPAVSSQTRFSPSTSSPLDEGEYSSLYSPESTSLSTERGDPFTVQTAPGVLIHPRRMIDLWSNVADAPTDQQLGILLALEANELATWFDEQWSVEELLESLGVVLKGIKAMPKISRRTLGRKLLQFGAAAVVSGIPIPTSSQVSAEERAHLCQALGDSIAAGWKLLYSVSNAQILAIAHAQLFLVQQNHAWLYPKARSLCYTGVYSQIGMALHFQQRDEEALQAYRSSYIAALDAGEPWYVAQSLICQSDSYHALGQYSTAIQTVEEALRILGNPTDQHMIQARAHLLSCWADNAMMLRDYGMAQKKLDEAEAYLDRIELNEEFDQASWLLLAGKYALQIGDYAQARSSFQRALKLLPDQWVLRRTMTAIGLAMALARMREREESIAIAEKLIPMVATVDAQMTNQWFHGYLQQDLLEAFPQDDQVRTFVVDTRKRLPRLAIS